MPDPRESMRNEISAFLSAATLLAALAIHHAASVELTDDRDGPDL